MYDGRFPSKPPTLVLLVLYYGNVKMVRHPGLLPHRSSSWTSSFLTSIQVSAFAKRLPTFFRPRIRIDFNVEDRKLTLLSFTSLKKLLGRIFSLASSADSASTTVENQTRTVPLTRYSMFPSLGACSLLPLGHPSITRGFIVGQSPQILREQTVCRPLRLLYLLRI